MGGILLWARLLSLLVMEMSTFLLLALCPQKQDPRIPLQKKIHREFNRKLERKPEKIAGSVSKFKGLG